jgi:hypothetical protein
MQSLLHRSRWKQVLYFSLAVISWVLPGCSRKAAQPEVTQSTLEDIYGTGRLWIKTREMGIHKCTMHGVLETQVTGMDGEPPSEETPPVDVTYTMDLWYRLKSNQTHAVV